MSIYLDNSMTTRPSPKCVAQMIPMLTDMWGNPMAPHKKGQELFPYITQSYKALYQLFDATDRDTIIFTSSGAESVNQVFLSSYNEVTLPIGKNQYVASNIDEAPAMMSITRLEKMHCVGKMAHADKLGMITRDAIADVITPRTALISLSWANGLTGVINPVQEISQLCQERGILYHIEATHALGKIFFTREELNADFISLNGDNIHAPKGTGALYVREGVCIGSLIVGGLEQGGHRAGTINIPALVGLGQAAQEAIEARDLLCTETARLRNKLESGILAAIPKAVIFFKDSPRVPHITAIGFPGIANESLLYYLNRKGVYACIGGGSFQQIGLILKASGIDEKLANSAISFSLSRETTEDEIDRAITIIAESVDRLRHTAEALIK